MTKKDKSLMTTDDRLRAEAAEKKEAEREAGLLEQSTQAAEVPQEPETFVYCGPSVRGVARQYTVFTGGLPEEVKRFAAQHETAKAMIVPVDKFPEMRKKLETKGTAEALLYNKLKSDL